MISMSSAFGDTVMDDKVHDIKNFLRRPILCKTGVWGLTDLPNAVLTTMVMPADCLSKPLYREKLRGFYGFRAKMILRVQINASRFQQGRLLLHYLPEQVTKSAVRTNTANSCLGTKTQQPCIDLDCVDSEAILEVPYVSTALYFNLLSGENPYGTFYLTVYSSLFSPTGPATVDYSVWCHFEDVEVAYPTAALGTGPLMPQSGIGRRRRTPQDAELNSVGLGPISGLANRVSTAAGILSEVPLLSSVTAPVSWMADILSRSALAMGFSKPTNLAPPAKRQLTMFSNMTNVDGIDNSQKLSLTNTNAVEVLPGFAGSDVDEMSFAYLYKVPAYAQTISWSTNSSANSKIMQFRVTPGDNVTQLYQTIVVPTLNQGPQNLKAKPPYQYVANMFAYWRGSINFTFKFVKTEFHSGRLLVVFTPGKNIADVNCTIDSSQYCYREILDIRCANEYTVKIPYVSTTPYLPMSTWSGNLSVYVLNELRSPDTVSNQISILVETSGGDDLDYICPSIGPDRAVLYSQSGGSPPESRAQMSPMEQTLFDTSGVLNNVLGAVGATLNLGVLRPQSLGLGIAENGSATTQVEPDSIDHAVHSKDLNASKYIAGERILSARQLMKKFSTWYSGIPAPNAAFIVVVRPEFLTLPYFKSGQNVAYVAGTRIDAVSYLGSLFAFQRGGFRFKFVSDMTPGVVTGAQLFYYPAQAQNVIVSAGSGGISTSPFSPTVENASQFGGLEIEVPYGSYTHSRSVGYVCIGVPASVSADGGMQLNLSQSSGFNKDTRMYRAAADDLSFGFFIGCPLLVGEASVPYTQGA